MIEDMQSTREIAKIFGVSTRRVEQLKTEGIINGFGKPTKYELLPTVKAYIKHLSDKANGREKKDNESAKIEAEARYKKAKAEMAELQLKELKGELHRATDVEEIMTDHVLMIRGMLIALPNKLAVDLANIYDAAVCSEKIKSEVYFILNELSQYEYEPEEFKKRLRERIKWQNGNSEDE